MTCLLFVLPFLSLSILFHFKGKYILWMGQRNPAPPKGWLKRDSGINGSAINCCRISQHPLYPGSSKSGFSQVGKLTGNSQIFHGKSYGKTCRFSINQSKVDVLFPVFFKQWFWWLDFSLWIQKICPDIAWEGTGKQSHTLVTLC